MKCSEAISTCNALNFFIIEWSIAVSIIYYDTVDTLDIVIYIYLETLEGRIGWHIIIW